MTACRPAAHARAWRVRTQGAAIAFDDVGIQGRVAQDLEREIGDFVLYRADCVYAYQLAVVVDDAEQGITDVVRGADLLDSTPRQIHLQRLLGLPTPRYAHLPVAVNARGEKLSKQTLAPAVDRDRVTAALIEALRFLGQEPPSQLERAKVSELWQWALENWRMERVPRVRSKPVANERPPRLSTGYAGPGRLAVLEREQRSSPGRISVHVSLSVSGAVAITATLSSGVVSALKSTVTSWSMRCACAKGAWRRM